MLPRFRLRSERSVVQGVQNVRKREAILARHGPDVAIITNRVKPEPLENGNGVGMTLFHVTDDHVAADQLIESEHRRASRKGTRCTSPSKSRTVYFQRFESVKSIWAA